MPGTSVGVCAGAGDEGLDGDDDGAGADGAGVDDEGAGVGRTGDDEDAEGAGDGVREVAPLGSPDVPACPQAAKNAVTTASMMSRTRRTLHLPSTASFRGRCSIVRCECPVATGLAASAFG